MSTAYERAKLSSEWGSFLHEWESLIRTHPEVDELGASIAAAVLDHLARDGTFLDGTMTVFLKVLQQRSEEPIVNGDVIRLQEEYKQSCYRTQRTGQQSSLLDRLLHVIPDAQLRAMINSKYGEAPDAHSDHWRRFRDAIDRGDEPAALKKLDGVALHPFGFQLFATSPVVEIIEVWHDPATWDATTVCAVLGLSLRWDGYRKGDRLWLIEYALSGVDAVAYVPTTADAEWRSIYRPSSDRSTDFGMTVTLGHIRQAQEAAGVSPIGMPEVVHACPLVSTRALAGPNMAHVDDPPRFLGEHAGW